LPAKNTDRLTSRAAVGDPPDPDGPALDRQVPRVFHVALRYQ
jgi:hypothetical protein